MLNLYPFLDQIEEIMPGQTIRVNHTECEAGEDTRRRLYLTRTHADEGVTVGYCHNCQQTGYIKDGKFTAYRNTKHQTYVTHAQELVSNVEEPKGLIDDIRSWPTLAKAWLIKSSLEDADIEWYGIKYDPSTDRIYLPRWGNIKRGSTGKRALLGYQLRSLHNYNRPKYITAQRKDAKNYTVIRAANNQGGAAIVEDLVSGIHISKADPTLDVYINYGTRVDPMVAYTIATTYRHVYVWLDNDSTHVINQAKLMQRTITMYNDDIYVYRIEDASDPKHYTNVGICQYLGEAMNG